MTDGTIFEGQFGEVIPGVGNQVLGTVTFLSGGTLLDGVVATLNVDTTGIESGDFELFFVQDGLVDTFFTDLNDNVIGLRQGSVTFTVVPEPASALLLTGAATGLLRRRRRLA